jgi:hypothetical protein
MFSFTFFCTLSAADSANDGKIIKRDSEKAIQTFTPDHYGNSQFKVIFWGPNRLEQFIPLALQATIPPDETAPIKKLICYVRAIHFIQESLLHKPYKLWKLKDLKAINAKLSEFIPSVESPGEFRTFNPTPRLLRVFSEEETARLKMLQNDPSSITESDQAFVSKNLHIFPPARDVTLHVAQMLVRMKLDIQAREQRSECDTDGEINLVGFLHQNIREIRPWPKRNKATARLLGHIICMQNGIEPPTFEDKQTYIGVTTYCVRKKQFAPLSDYIRGLIHERQQWKASAEKEA